MPAEHTYQKSKTAISKGVATSAILAQIDLALEHGFNVLVVGYETERKIVSEAVRELASQYGNIREIRKGETLDQILFPGEPRAFFAMDLDVLGIREIKKYIAKVKDAAAESKENSLIMDIEMHCAQDALRSLMKRGLSDEELTCAQIIYVAKGDRNPEIYNLFGITPESVILTSRCDIKYAQQGEFDNNGKLILKSKDDISEFIKNLTQYAQKPKVLNLSPHNPNFILEAIAHNKQLDGAQLEKEILNRIAKFETVIDDSVVADFFARGEAAP